MGRRVNFPTTVDDFGFTTSLSARNAGITFEKHIDLETLAYAIVELEKAVSSLDPSLGNSTTSSAEVADIKNRLAIAENNILAIQATLALLSSGGIQHYEGAGAPSGGLGVNGDTYFDTTDKFFYTKLAGDWIQQP